MWRRKADFTGKINVITLDILLTCYGYYLKRLDYLIKLRFGARNINFISSKSAYILRAVFYKHRMLYYILFLPMNICLDLGPASSRSFSVLASHLVS
jgi:hypothetical protein